MNTSSLEPLYAAWEEPARHRVRADEKRAGSLVQPGRRPSPITVVNNLRNAVRDWREAGYPGASATSRHLMDYWFCRDHRRTTPEGEEFPFRYYFCQREAIETLIYVKEARQLGCLSQIIAEFGGPDAEIAALGVAPEEDAWSRYAVKMATGAGKTKVMSLAIVWSYFHALRESDSPMARHFVVIAPNLTVYERLKADFGGGRIFDEDPLLPVEWKGDWNLSVVLQDEASGAATGGTLYLTNIHRLYDMSRRKGRGGGDTYPWVGPPVSKATALDTGAALRDRITGHARVMVLNDEAHHLWDPGSAWNEAIRYLHETIKARTGGGISAQVDFSATPKDNSGQVFKHVVCDAPLGEAVDAGIVKTPIIGVSRQKLEEQPDDNAAYRWERHLRLGYQRWQSSRDEWDKSGKKALLFVMCEDTKAADQIAERFNNDPIFADLNGRTINLHTNLKGKLKKIGRGASARVEFVEDEKAIKDEDLKALRELSRNLDRNTSQYACIVSVLMLREGWDVRNVTTIVPLRPYSSKANILPEQTLGRGLRRMTPPGQVDEMVTVVDHPAFASLYQQELAKEGVLPEVMDTEAIQPTTVSIFPDELNKDIAALDIALPVLTAAYVTLPDIERLTVEDVRHEFAKYRPLPLGQQGPSAIDYEGRHLFTGEVVERETIEIELLKNGVGAITYYRQQLERICRITGTHQKLAPLLQTFLEEMLFEEKSSLFDPRLVARLGDQDVAEHIRAVFVPLILKRITTVQVRQPDKPPRKLSQWKPFQAAHSERRPAIEAGKTLFNLVTCNRELEVGLAKFADNAPDAAAFAKNAGPQCLRIDYLTAGHRLAFYTADFFIRTVEGTCYLVETKGREDPDVPRKARAAIEWCASASKQGVNWEYLYVPQGVFERMKENTVDELARTCRPALQQLLESEREMDEAPLLALMAAGEEESRADATDFISSEKLAELPKSYAGMIGQAVTLFTMMQNKADMEYSPAFQCLLGSVDDACRALIMRRLMPLMPESVDDQKAWFSPYLHNVDPKLTPHYKAMASNLRKTLVFRSGISPIGLLRSCLDYALNDNSKLTGVFEGIKSAFRRDGARAMLRTVETLNDFRNAYVAHKSEDLHDPEAAKRMLQTWTNALHTLHTWERG